MNPPSEVTVLSESDPIPSLLPLLLEALDKLSSPERETVSGITREIGGFVGTDERKGDAAMTGVEGKASRFSGRDNEDLLRAWRDPRDRGVGLFATTFDKETEVVAGVTEGREVTVCRRMLDERLGGVEVFSSSTSFRFGDDCKESTRRLGVSTPFLVSRRSF